MLYQCKLINCKKRITLVEDIANGEGYAYVGQYMGNLYSLLSVLL